MNSHLNLITYFPGFIVDSKIIGSKGEERHSMPNHIGRGIKEQPGSGGMEVERGNGFNNIMAQLPDSPIPCCSPEFIRIRAPFPGFHCRPSRIPQSLCRDLFKPLALLTFPRLPLEDFHRDSHLNERTKGM